MIFEDDDEAPGPEVGASEATADRARTATISHPRHEVTRASPPRFFHPPSYRGVVAGWPEDWRERWGRRANELEEAGLSWRDAEAQAFVEVWNKVRQAPHTRALAPSDSDPERN
jgi:hypothetical protein